MNGSNMHAISHLKRSSERTPRTLLQQQSRTMYRRCTTCEEINRHNGVVKRSMPVLQLSSLAGCSFCTALIDSVDLYINSFSWLKRLEERLDATGSGDLSTYMESSVAALFRRPLLSRPVTDISVRIRAQACVLEVTLMSSWLRIGTFPIRHGKRRLLQAVVHLL